MNTDTIIRQLEQNLKHRNFDVSEITEKYVYGYDYNRETEFKAKLTPSKRIKKHAIYFGIYPIWEFDAKQA